MATTQVGRFVTAIAISGPRTLTLARAVCMYGDHPSGTICNRDSDQWSKNLDACQGGLYVWRPPKWDDL